MAGALSGARWKLSPALVQDLNGSIYLCKFLKAMSSSFAGPGRPCYHCVAELHMVFFKLFGANTEAFTIAWVP